MAKGYPSDLTDAQWALPEPLIPAAKPGGRPRPADMRRVLGTIFHAARSGGQWAVIPGDLAERSAAFEYFSAWQKDGTWQASLDALRRRARAAPGREPEPSKAAIDTPSVEGGESGGPRGYDGGKKIGGRKRHLLADTPGFLPVALATPANVDGGPHAPKVPAKLSESHPSRLDEIRGDGKYDNRTLDKWMADEGVGYRMTVVERPKGVRGLVLLPYRRVAGRTDARNGKYRRNSKDYERTPESAEAMLLAGAIHRLLNRPAPDTDRPDAPFKYPRKPMQKAA